jgi:hypothetical protein
VTTQVALGKMAVQSLKPRGFVADLLPVREQAVEAERLGAGAEGTIGIT